MLNDMISVGAYKPSEDFKPKVIARIISSNSYNGLYVSNAFDDDDGNFRIDLTTSKSKAKFLAEDEVMSVYKLFDRQVRFTRLDTVEVDVSELVTKQLDHVISVRNKYSDKQNY